MLCEATFDFRERAIPRTRWIRWVWVLGILIAVGCATPTPVVTNLVLDSDVRGCSPEGLDGLKELDVALVIDTSMSTRRPSGLDIDGDGRASKLMRIQPSIAEIRCWRLSLIPFNLC